MPSCSIKCSTSYIMCTLCLLYHVLIILTIRRSERLLLRFHLTSYQEHRRLNVIIHFGSVFIYYLPLDSKNTCAQWSRKSFKNRAAGPWRVLSSKHPAWLQSFKTFIKVEKYFSQNLHLHFVSNPLPCRRSLWSEPENMFVLHFFTENKVCWSGNRFCPPTWDTFEQRDDFQR